MRTPLLREVSPDGAWVASQTKIACGGAGAWNPRIEIDVRRSNPAQGDIGDVVYFEGTRPVDLEWAAGSVTLIAPSVGRFYSEEWVTAALTVRKPPPRDGDIRGRK